MLPGPVESPSSAPRPASKSRSCVVCRSRKVRCDRQSPCSNCRRAKIACVFPSTDRPPRWAERLHTSTAPSNAPASRNADLSVVKVIDRLQNLENLVKELRGQLEDAHAAAGRSANASLSELNPPTSSAQDRDTEHQEGTSPAAHIGNVQTQFGRLVLQNTSGSRYVSSGFWSRIQDELERLKMEARSLPGNDYDSSEDEESPEKSPSNQEFEQRTTSERHVFFFRHTLNPSAPELTDFHPLPSQIPFLLDVFSENVNFTIQVVHMPTINRMVRDARESGMTSLTPADEALMFSIYYAAIASMEEDDVMVNFGSNKTDLSLKYRLGLEYALAKADFLNVANIVLIQAFAIFLFLVRRHDSPRFVWMMTGLLVRMAQYLGLQRDGAHFEGLTPFEIEMRRRVWGAVCVLDARASDDQGTDLTIVRGSFDTKIPLNINDTDINPETKHMPTERNGVTDMSFARICIESYDIMSHLMTDSMKDGTASLEERSRMINEIYQRWEQGYLQYTSESENTLYWVAVTVARITMAKWTLIVFLPVLFSSPSKDFSDEIRIKLLISAIEVAENNHALNAEHTARQWRWIYQTYTHWHAIVYLVIEISRRPWSPIVERGWVALHSSWLIPPRAAMNEKSRIWVPLRKLIATARKHRDTELKRLRADPQAANRLEMEDQNIPSLPSSAPFAGVSSSDTFLERWRQLVAMPERSRDTTQASDISSSGFTRPSMHTTHTDQQATNAAPSYRAINSSMSFGPTYPGSSEQQVGQAVSNTEFGDLEPATAMSIPTRSTLGDNTEPPVPWLLADPDPSDGVFSTLDMDAVDADMNLDPSDVNWYDWVESARGMESETRRSDSDRS